MSLTHRDLAAYVAAMYDPNDKTPWLYKSNPDAMMVFGIIRVGEYLLVVPRGSYVGRDWLLDALVSDVSPAAHPELKCVHRGFYTGTPEGVDIVRLFYRPVDKVIIIGHSLGGGRGEIVAEELVAIGIIPHLVITWGQPAAFKPSMPDPKYPFYAYRNVVDGDEDDVTWSTAIAGYRHRVPFIDVSATPAKRNKFDPFDLHHFVELYQPATPDTLVPA
jgi:hypothetical protein